MIHRDDSVARQHYLIDKRSFIDFNPELLYSGKLNKMEGWRDTAHSHNFLEIIYILDGAGTVTVEDREYRVGRGDLIIYNAGSRHFEHNSSDAPLEALFAAFNKIQLKDLPENCILPPHAECIFTAEKMRQEFVTLFDIINIEIAHKQEFYIEIAEKAAHALLMYTFRILNDKRTSFEMLKKDTILQDVLYYIDCHFVQDIGLEDISSKCFVNKYYLSHLFTEHLDMTVGQYIRNKRIELAKTMLMANELSASDIAERCGFNDLNYFVRLFKKVTGLTPLQYRKLNVHI